MTTITDLRERHRALLDRLDAAADDPREVRAIAAAMRAQWEIDEPLLERALEEDGRDDPSEAAEGANESASAHVRRRVGKQIRV